ncbi:16S rRNA (uracil1498-N3)-methyltransferase [Leucobacter komagatae]|uniref:Ribosomal RNA small subunit methyltransferase E n=1 Tax=Leucobacter komagatae TaxID=55969 RepID=A0A542Y3Q4_9MICO|nr:16S rRNA (uracil(1498)-N(3))-methyltransferase [Leucobacter komagatae]TQL42691.1 16S rRNA (uracil1498-N3)-methyltransferase [Leucobacter komagatae]
MANLYFDESLADTEPGGLITVSGDEGRHAVRVSRLRLGEQTIVGNGRGLRAFGAVTELGRDSFTVAVERVEEVPAPARRLVLVQALAKGDRDERAVEQATEFGVDAIVPWQAERSVSRWVGEKAEKGVAKWSRIAREASKQSMRGWIPEVLQPVATADLAALDGHVIALHPRGEERLSAWRPPDERDVYLVVGPEGGLTDIELSTLTAQGPGERQIALLGNNVLRTSSAGPAAIAVLNAALGRW